MSEKAADVQRKTMKDLQKSWRTIAQDHFKRLQQSLAAWKQNIGVRCVSTFFMRMLRLSEAFLTNGDFLERVELSLSLRLICKHMRE